MQWRHPMRNWLRPGRNQSNGPQSISSATQLEGSHRDLWIMPWVAKLSHSPLRLCGPASTAPSWTNLAPSTAKCAVCLAAKTTRIRAEPYIPPGTAVRVGVLPCIPAVLECLILNSSPPSLTVSDLNAYASRVLEYASNPTLWAASLGWWMMAEDDGLYPCSTLCVSPVHSGTFILTKHLGKAPFTPLICLCGPI